MPWNPGLAIIERLSEKQRVDAEEKVNDVVMPRLLAKMCEKDDFAEGREDADLRICTTTEAARRLTRSM